MQHSLKFSDGPDDLLEFPDEMQLDTGDVDIRNARLTPVSSQARNFTHSIKPVNTGEHEPADFGRQYRYATHIRLVGNFECKIVSATCI